jgi:hypothetical protein
VVESKLQGQVAQTTALLRRGAEYRRQRINASDMITTDEAAELSGTTRVTINIRIKTCRCIGVTHLRRGFKLPKWQFEPCVFHRVQLIRPRATSVQMNGLAMPPVGLMHGRFCLPNEAVAYLADSPETAL